MRLISPISFLSSFHSTADISRNIYIGDWGLNFGNGENYRNVILEEGEKWEKDESKDEI